MKTERISKGMMTLAAIVLVGGTACEQEGAELGSDTEALQGEGRTGRHGRRMNDGMGFGPRNMAQLELSEEQQASIANLRTQAQERLSSTREQMGTLRGELHELWQADQPDAEAILAKQAEMDALRSTVRENRQALSQATHEVLTAEQRAQLAERRSNGPTKGMRGRRGGGAGMGRHGGFGMGGPGMGGPGMGGPGMGGHGMGGHGMGRMGHPGQRGLGQLVLSEAQRSQIDALHAQLQDATSQARAELREVRQAMHNARSSDEVNEETMDALHARAAAAQQVIREQGVRTRIAVLGVLTTGQRAELEELRATRGARRGRGFGQGQGFGDGEGRMMGEGRGFGRGRGSGTKGFGRGPGGGFGDAPVDF